METVQRHFLGYERTPLAAAAAALIKRHGTDLSELIVALPGGRAARRLGHHLAREAGPGWVPPRLVTQGDLVDELLPVDRPVASRLVRTLAWERALDELPEDLALALAPHAGRRGDRHDLRFLAPRLRALHQEFVSAGLDFDAVPPALGEDVDDELGRWRALARAQTLYRQALESAGVGDPHDLRRAALDRGVVPRVGPIALVGVVDMTTLLRRALEVARAEVHVYVPADESWSDDVDELGCLLLERVEARPLAFDDEAWRVVDGPADQAREALHVLASWQDELTADRLSIGVPDREVAPHLSGALRARGVEGRDPGARVVGESPPAQLLRALARFLERRRFGELAELWRHPDLERHLGFPEGTSAASDLDSYHDRRLPHAAPGTFLGANADSPRDPGPRLTAAWSAMGATLGELTTAGGTRTLRDWVPALDAALQGVYGDDTYDPDREADRERLVALRALADALDDLEAIPEALDPRVRASEAIGAWLEAVASSPIPPAGARAGEPTVELLGWLEVPLDDAEGLVLTGVQEGSLPDSDPADPFLPDGLRRRLGLPSDQARSLRDRFNLELVLRTRRCVMITGRRSGKGDPLRPSRILFHTSNEQVVPRVRRWTDGAGAHPRPPAGESRPQPVPTPLVAPERWAVTSFRAYLSSPVLWHLQRAVGLRTIDDEAREMDPATFGTLAHDVLDEMAREGPLDATDPEVLGDWLVERLDARVAARFGRHALPAVRLQARQLAYRLRRFASWQVKQHAEGWRILASEWQPEGGGVPFDVDGTPILLRGKVDRIDRRGAEWRILDYKTGKAMNPDSTHRKKGEWVDLQLPLYVTLTRELAEQHGLLDMPQLGYVNLPKGDAGSTLALPKKPWTQDDLADAELTACRVVRQVREGRITDVGDPGRYLDPMFQDLVDRARLCGLEVVR